MPTLVFSPWYINTRRLADFTGIQLSPRAQTSVVNNSGDRAEAMNHARFVAQRVVQSAKVRSLADLITKEQYRGRVTAWMWADATFGGSSAASMASERGRPF